MFMDKKLLIILFILLGLILVLIVAFYICVYTIWSRHDNTDNTQEMTETEQMQRDYIPEYRKTLADI